MEDIMQQGHYIAVVRRALGKCGVGGLHLLKSSPPPAVRKRLQLAHRGPSCRLVQSADMFGSDGS